MQKCLRCGLEFTQNLRSTPQIYCTEKCRKKMEKKRWHDRNAPARAEKYAAYLAEHEPIWAAARAAKEAKRRPRDLLERWVDRAVWWPSGCLLWVGSVDEFGYPRLKYEGRLVRVTRMICGVEDERRALHTCDVPCCINPEHLYVGTGGDNFTDMVRRGRAKLNFPKARR